MADPLMVIFGMGLTPPKKVGRRTRRRRCHRSRRRARPFSPDFDPPQKRGTPWEKRGSTSVRQDASPGKHASWRGGGHPFEESTPRLGQLPNYGGGRLCPTYQLVRHRGCHARWLVRSSHTRVRGLAGAAYSTDIALCEHMRPGLRKRTSSSAKASVPK